MRGRIWAESELGRGSVFVIELERAAVPLSDETLTAARLAGENPRAVMAAGTLLYIEDNLSNLRLVEQIFAGQPQIRLIPAMQGEVGFDLAKQHSPDLILLDLHLPDMPGEAVFERLRTHPVTREIPIVVLSADATERQIQRLLHAGAAGYLTKPLDIPRFLEVVRNNMNRQPAGMIDVAPDASPELEHQLAD
jgi:CheY-like chemotaxis protein